MKRTMLASAACLTLFGAAQAQDAMTTAQARDMLFRENGRSVSVPELDFLGAAERRALETYGAQFAYYGAMAVSPGDRVDSGSAVALANFHSPQAAQAAALAGCEARRKTGAPCIIVATIAPRRFEQRALTLSVEATAALKDEYRKLDTPKAFAISPSTGAWAFARGDGARALDQCAGKASGAGDCRVVVADE
jgi:hypothetical protein